MTNDKTTDLTADDLVEMYRLMLLGRRFTETARELHKQGRASPMHPSIGQEAVGVGACHALRPGDWVLPSLRTTEAFWARGVTVQEKVDALLGTAGSISRGKEGSHHAGYPDRGVLSGSGMIGSQFPVATGAALALRMQDTDNVVVCFFGDGASNRGDFHEGLNIAAVLGAPVIFICENNMYAQTVPAADAMVITDIADRAAGYGMPGRIVDGQDVLAVHEATQAAVGRARSGQGPSLLECKTYRFKEHHPWFDEDRPAEEINEWLQRDPIDLFGRKLADEGYLDRGAMEAMDRAIRKELDDAVKQAEATGPAEPAEAFTEIYGQSMEEMGL